MGRNAPGRRLRNGDAHGQAPRRILPLAHPNHGALGEELPLDGGPRRRGGDAPPLMRQVRCENGSLRLSVGPQRRLLRHGEGLRRFFRAADHRTADRLRRDRRGVVRRRQRLGGRRQASGLRLGPLHTHREGAATRSRHGHHGRRHPLGGQRSGQGTRRGVERHGPGPCECRAEGPDARRRSPHRDLARSGQPCDPRRSEGAVLVSLGGGRVDPPGLVLPRLGG